MGTEKTKSYPIRMPEAVMNRVRESAALANLKQGEFISNLLAMYELRLRHAYRSAGVDLTDRCEELDSSFMNMLLNIDREGSDFRRDQGRATDEKGVFFNRENDSLSGEMAWNIGNNFKLSKQRVSWGEPEIILPKDKK